MKLYLAKSEYSAIKKNPKKIIFGIFAFLSVAGLLFQPFANLSAAAPRLNMFTPYSCAYTGSHDYYVICVKNETKGTDYNLSVSADPGDVLVFSLYYHNGVLNTSAINTGLRASLPSGSSTSHSVSGYLWADNAENATAGSPLGNSVSVNISSAQTLQFISGSGEWFPNQTSPLSDSPASLPSGQTGDSIVSGGINVGNIQGCWEYSGLFNFKVRIGQSVQENPNLTIEKTVKNITTGTGYSDSVSAHNGDRIGFNLRIDSTGSGAAQNVIVSDSLPSGLSYVSGSAKVDNGSASDSIISNGINIGSMNQGATRNVTFEATVNTNSNVTLTNTGFARADNVGQKQDTAQVVVNQVITPPPQNPDFSISKTVRNVSNNEASFSESTQATPGQTVEFQIIIVSTGNTAINNVGVRDELPSRLAYVSGSTKVGGSSSGDGIVSSGIVIGDLASGQTKTITFQANVAGEGNFSAGQTTLTNTAFGRPNFAISPSSPEKSDTAQVIVNKSQPQNPNLAISKTVKDITDGGSYTESVNAEQNDRVGFKIVVENTGDISLSNLIVRDSLPSGLSYVSGTLVIGGNSGYSSTDFFNSNGSNTSSLSIGSTLTITFEATVTTNSSQTLTNYGYAKADNVSEKNDTAQVVVSQVNPQNPNLAISKTVRNISNNESNYSESTNAHNGDRIGFNLRIDSIGSSAAQNVIISDSLPSGLSYVSGSARVDGNSASDSIISNGINIGSMNQGATRNVTFEATVNTNSNVTLTNTGFARADNVNQISDTAQVVVSQVNPVIFGDLIVSKLVRNETAFQSFLAASVNANAGDRILFSIQVQAINTQSVTNVRLQDNLPSGLSYVFGSTRVGNGFFGDGIVSGGINIGTLFAGQSQTITFEATVNGFAGSQTLVNTVYASGDNVPQRSASAQVVVNQPIPPQSTPTGLTKAVANLTSPNGTATDNTARISDTLQYTLSYQNTTGSVLNGVQIMDVLPSYTIFSSVANNGVYNSSNNMITWNIGTLSPGASVSVSYQVQVASSVPAGGTVITNTALLRAQGINDVISNETRTTVILPMVKGVVKAVTGSDSMTVNSIFSLMLGLVFSVILYFILNNTDALRALKFRLVALKIRTKEGL